MKVLEESSYTDAEFLEPVVVRKPTRFERCAFTPKGLANTVRTALTIESGGVDFDDCEVGSSACWYGSERRRQFKPMFGRGGPDAGPDMFDDPGRLAEDIEEVQENPFVRFVNTRFRNVQKDAMLTPDYTLVYGCTMEDCGNDGVKIGGGYFHMRGTTIRQLGRDPKSHADAVHVAGGRHIYIERNTLAMPHPLKGGPEGHQSNGLVFVKPTHGAISDVYVYDNYLDGGTYSVWAVRHPTTGREASRYELFGNRFGRNYFYGILAEGTPVATHSNTWADTGAPIDMEPVKKDADRELSEMGAPVLEHNFKSPRVDAPLVARPDDMVRMRMRLANALEQ